jgi:hypothetical protein
MMSDSPTVGHETPDCAPSIQNAGHNPACEGICKLASMRPAWNVCSPAVFSRAEVHVLPTDRTWIAKCPLPSMYSFVALVLHGDVFDVGAQYVSSSLLPHPPAPVS